MELQEFIDKLKEQANSGPEVDEHGFLVEDVPEDIATAIDDLFITPKGNPNYVNILACEDVGVKVYAGETDGFGWVTGVVEIPGKLKILF